MAFFSFLTLFALYPYIFYLSTFLHLSSGEKNPLLIIILILFLLIYFFSKAQRNTKIQKESLSRDETYLYLFLFFAALAIQLIRYFFYGDPWAEIMLSSATVFFLPFYFFLAIKMIDTSKKAKLVARVIVVSAIIQALVGVIHATFFPDVNWLGQVVGEEGFVAGSRETGIFTNASGYAYSLCVGLFLLAAYIPAAKGHQKYLLMLLSAFIFYGVLLSKSRFPIAVSLILLFIPIIRTNRARLRLILFFGVLALFVFCFHEFFDTLLQGIGWRFENGNDERTTKYFLALQFLLTNFSSVIAGISTAMQAISYDGVTFSDNSYLTVALNFGVPFTLIYFYCFLKSGFQRFKTFNQRSVLFFIFASMVITNAILWNFWILYVFAVVRIFSFYEQGKLNFKERQE